MWDLFFSPNVLQLPHLKKKKKNEKEDKLWKDLFHIPDMYGDILEMQTEGGSDETALSLPRMR